MMIVGYVFFITMAYGATLMPMEMSVFAKKHLEQENALISAVTTYQRFSDCELIDIVKEIKNNPKNAELGYVFLKNAAKYIFKGTPTARNEFINLPLTENDIQKIVRYRKPLYPFSTKCDLNTQSYEDYDRTLFDLGMDNFDRIWLITNKGISMIDTTNTVHKKGSGFLPTIWRNGSFSLCKEFAIGISGKSPNDFSLNRCFLHIFDMQREKMITDIQCPYGADGIAIDDKGIAFVERQQKKNRELINILPNNSKENKASFIVAINLKNDEELKDIQKRLSIYLAKNSEHCYVTLNKTDVVKYIDFRASSAIQTIPVPQGKEIQQITHDGFKSLFGIDTQGIIYLWDVRSNKTITTINAKILIDYPAGIALHADTYSLAVGCNDGEIQLYDVRSREIESSQKVWIKNSIRRLAWNGDGSTLIADQNYYKSSAFLSCSRLKRKESLLHPKLTTAAQLLAYLGDAIHNHTVSNDCPQNIQEARTEVIKANETGNTQD